MSFPSPRPVHAARLTLAVLLGLLAALVLALPAGASTRHHAAPRAAAPFTVKVTTTTHTPLTCVNWWIDVYVTRNGQKLSGQVTHYDFTFNGQNVSGSQPAGDRSNRFGHFTDGFFRDNLVFPTAAKNEHLVLQVWVTTRYGRNVVTNVPVTPRANPHKQCRVNGH